MLSACVGNSEKFVGNNPANIPAKSNVPEEMEHMVEYSCICRKKEVILKRAGILPTHAGSIVPAHPQICRKLLYEWHHLFKFMPQLQKKFSYLYDNIIL